MWASDRTGPKSRITGLTDPAERSAAPVRTRRTSCRRQILAKHAGKQKARLSPGFSHLTMSDLTY